MSSALLNASVSARVRTDAAFAKAVHAACAQRALSFEALAAQAQVPLSAVRAIHRRAPVFPEFVSALCRVLELPVPPFSDLAPLRRVGQLLRDRRQRAGLSRKALGHLARVSDGTLKFIEAGLHAPSRATCLRLVDVAELALTSSDLAPFFGPPAEPLDVGAGPRLLGLDPRVSRELVLEQMLLTDQLRLHQYGLESGPAGWRRLCWLCGARSTQAVLQAQEAYSLMVRHASVCPGQLAESLLRRYPIIAELAQRERRNLLTPTAQALHRGVNRLESEHVYGCRRATELGEQLVCVGAPPTSPYRSGVAAALLWALGFGPSPLGFAADAFSQEATRALLAAASENDLVSTYPEGFRRGVTETAVWILEPHAEPPHEPLAPSDTAPLPPAAPTAG